MRFADGSVEHIDKIVYCTGYRISFPFFDRALLDRPDDNRIELYRRVVHPDLDGLFFIGLIQPLERSCRSRSSVRVGGRPARGT